MFGQTEQTLQALKLHGENSSENVYATGIVTLKIPLKIFFWLSPNGTLNLTIIRKKLERNIVI